MGVVKIVFMVEGGTRGFNQGVQTGGFPDLRFSVPLCLAFSESTVSNTKLSEFLALAEFQGERAQ